MGHDYRRTDRNGERNGYIHGGREPWNHRSDCDDFRGRTAGVPYAASFELQLHGGPAFGDGAGGDVGWNLYGYRADWLRLDGGQYGGLADGDRDGRRIRERNYQLLGGSQWIGTAAERQCRRGNIEFQCVPAGSALRCGAVGECRDRRRGGGRSSLRCDSGTKLQLDRGQYGSVDYVEWQRLRLRGRQRERESCAQHYRANADRKPHRWEPDIPDYPECEFLRRHAGGEQPERGPRRRDGIGGCKCDLQLDCGE